MPVPPYSAVPTTQAPMSFEDAIQRARAAVGWGELVTPRITAALLAELNVRAERIAELEIDCRAALDLHTDACRTILDLEAQLRHAKDAS